MTAGSARIGIDIGGTFTDLLLVGDGRHAAVKIPSTRRDPSEAVAAGLAELMRHPLATELGVSAVAHGTTVGTNAMLEGSHASAGLLTTEGFRDLLEIGSQRRPDLYDLFFEKPAPLVPRALRREVRERLAADGSVLEEVDVEGALEEGARLVAEGVDSIAVCFLHSYVVPAHERRVKEALQHAFPEVPVWISSEALPEYREFERLSTTIVHASLGPVMSAYLRRFAQRCREAGLDLAPTIMQSNGGTATLEEAAALPGNTLLSGPAAGVLGAVHVAQAGAVEDFLTLDMGGTSTDISLIRKAKPTHVRLREIGGHPVRGSSMDINAIGAGGGSIAWIDAGGRLCVGPTSAGAEPGPAAYGRGGERPTVTDANVVTGRLAGDTALGGRLRLDREAATRAVSADIGAALGLSVDEAALAILQIVNTNMALAARVTSVARGHDPRDYAMVAYGGAGPLHAVDVARELGVREVIIPPLPGMLCALGLLVSDPVTHFTQTRLLGVDASCLEPARTVWASLQARAGQWSERQDAGAHVVVSHEVDVRYRGQHHEITVATPAPPWDRAAVDEVFSRFVRAHEELYGYAAGDEPAEIVNFRVVAVATNARTAPAVPPAAAEGVPAPAPRAERPVLWEAGTAYVPTPVHDRERLRPGHAAPGPAIVEQDDATTAVPPGADFRIDAAGNLRIRPGGPTHDTHSREDGDGLLHLP